MILMRCARDNYGYTTCRTCEIEDCGEQDHANADEQDCIVGMTIGNDCICGKHE